MGQYAPRAVLSLDRAAIDSFAGEITRRAAQTAPGDNKARDIDDKGLSTALGNSVEYVKKTFGDNAGRAVMGIVLGHAGQGALTEEKLGDGFVSALEFIDKNFGTASGDQAMGVFNGELNQALNGYFQNGKQESFLAAGGSGAQQAAGQAVATAMTQTPQSAGAAPETSLFDQLAKDAEEYPLKPQAGAGENTLQQSSVDAVDAPGDILVQSQALTQPGVETTGLDGTSENQPGQTGVTASKENTAQTARKHRANRVRRKRPTGSYGSQASGYALGSTAPGIQPGVLVNASV